MPRNWSRIKGVDRTKKCIYRHSQPCNKKAFFLTSQAQAGRRLQYPVVQTFTFMVIPLQNEATSRTWIYVRVQENKTNRNFVINILIKLNLIFLDTGQRNSGLSCVIYACVLHPCMEE